MERAIIGASVLIGYSILVLLIGVWAYRHRKLSVEDYVTTGSTMGLLVLMFTYSATYHSAFAFMGTAGWVFRDGVGWWVNGLWTVLPGVAFWIIGRRVWALGKKCGYLSLGHYIRGVYDSLPLGILVAIIGIIFVFPYIGLQAAGVGYIFYQMTGGIVTPWMSSLIFIVLLTAYTWLGGMRGIAWTDTLQGLIMLVAIPLGGFLIASSTFGGVGSLYAAGAEWVPSMFTLPGARGAMTYTGWLSTWIPITAGMIVMPHVFLRYFAGINLRTMKWAAVGSCFFLTFIYVLVPAVGIGGKMLMPNVGVSDQIFLELLLKYLPFGLVAFMFAGALAASMSTADSQLHASSVLLANDIYGQVTKASSKSLFFITRYVVVIFAVVSLAIAWMGLTFADLLKISTAGLAVLSPSIIGPLFWSRSNDKGAWASIIGGMTSLVILQFVIGSILGISSALWAFIISIILFIAVSCLSTPNESVLKHYNFLRAVLGKNVETSQKQ